MDRVAGSREVCWVFCHTQPKDHGPWSKSLTFIFPTKYVATPKSLKLSHWLSQLETSSRESGRVKANYLLSNR